MSKTLKAFLIAAAFALTATVAYTASDSGIFCQSASCALKFYTRDASNVATSVGQVTTSGWQLKGVTDGTAASAGSIGEFSSANSAGVSPAASNSWKTLASLSLTPGDWWVTGTAALTHGTATGLNTVAGSISLTNDGSDSLSLGNICSGPQSGSSITYACAGTRRISITSTTTVYLVGLAVYSTVGTAQWAANSYVSARRVR